MMVLGGGCQKPNSSSPILPDESILSELSPGILINTMHLQSFGETGIEWEMYSPHVKGYPRENVFRARDLDIFLFDNGQKSSSIKANDGIIVSQDKPRNPTPPKSYFGSPKLNRGDMFLRGDVVVVSTDGTKVLTDWINFKRNQAIIVSTAPVQVIRDDSVTHGIGLEATPDLTSLKIFDETMIIKGEEEGLTEEEEAAEAEEEVDKKKL